MITVTELVVMAHDADRIKGRICKNCEHWRPCGSVPPHCRKRMHPADEDDSCPSWRPRADRTAA